MTTPTEQRSGDRAAAGGETLTVTDNRTGQTYEIEVTDLSDFHNFHLTGPSVNEDTGVAFTGKVTWHVTLGDGNYVYVCDVHPSSMRGTFTAGTPPTTNPGEDPALRGSATRRTPPRAASRDPAGSRSA